MANSKYEYVRAFERVDTILPNTYIVIRVDGRAFHKLTTKYAFQKPNDRRALDLMNAAAEGVLKEVQELILAYGQSDEYSFVFGPSTTLFLRRESKLTTTVVSTFTSYYTHLWATFFPDKTLSPPLPSFDARAVAYPSVQNLRDYLSWRQTDCHINNLYNTTFWALVNRGGLVPQEAEKQLAGTYSKDKNEILFSRFGINYNNEPEINRKGSVLYRDSSDVGPSNENPSSDISTSPAATAQPDLSQLERPMIPLSQSRRGSNRMRQVRTRITVAHIDIINDKFWEGRPWILSS